MAHLVTVRQVSVSGGWWLIIVKCSSPNFLALRHEALAGVQGGPARVGQALYQGAEGMAASPRHLARDSG